MGAKRLEDRVAGILRRVEKELDVAGGWGAGCGCAGHGGVRHYGWRRSWMRQVGEFLRDGCEGMGDAWSKRGVSIVSTSQLPVNCPPLPTHPQRPRLATSSRCWTWTAMEW